MATSEAEPASAAAPAPDEGGGAAGRARATAAATGEAEPAIEAAPAPDERGGAADARRERRDALLVLGLGALLCFPWLGAPGLWDPWETHYAEVARSMLARQDLVYPWWEGAYFFSKPPLLLWLMAAGMGLCGGNGAGEGELHWLTEWAVRTPVAGLAILAAALLCVAVGRIFSRRAGLLSALLLLTSPLYFFLARQAVTDLPFVALLTGALSCFAVAEWTTDRRSREHRELWLHAFYALLALATLAKGLLGLALPGAVILATLLVTADPRLLLRMRLPQGALVFCAIAVPWYLTLSLFDGKDDEGVRFAYRFFVHDHFKRLASGVHTTTPGGSFVYFVEQLGFGFFPWVAALPGAIAVAARARGRTGEPGERATLFLVLWALVAFTLFSLSSTKYHHYAFPALPALAVLAALFLDRLLEEELSEQLVPLLLGACLFALIAVNLWQEPKRLADLFVYNYERPYPAAELAEAPGIAIPAGARSLLFSLAPRPIFAGLFAGMGAAVVAAYLWRSRRFVVGSFAAGALLFALYGGWYHWRRLSPHWSQRELFHTYFAERAGLEPIGAYYMNWRGETFYSRNTVQQLKSFDSFRRFVAGTGREFVVVERDRLKSLQTTIGEGYRTRILDRSSNKYFLVSVEGDGLSADPPAAERPLGSPAD